MLVNLSPSRGAYVTNDENVGLGPGGAAAPDKEDSGECACVAGDYSSPLAAGRCPPPIMCSNNADELR